MNGAAARSESNERPRTFANGGMTGDEMAEQGPEFFEDYMSGMYSKPCEQCGGKNVVQVVNRKAITPELLARYEADELQIMQWEHERAMDY